MVIRRAADVIDIARAETFLTSCRAGKLELDLAQKVVFELVHAGRREQNRRIQVGTSTSLGWRLWPWIGNRKGTSRVIRQFSSFRPCGVIHRPSAYWPESSTKSPTGASALRLSGSKVANIPSIPKTYYDL